MAARNSSKPSRESKPSDSPGASPTEHPSYKNLTEDAAKHALIEARGDIFIASQLLGITAIRLDRMISVSPILLGTQEECKRKESRLLSAEEIHAAVERRVALYRVAGLDALHDLATMPLDENSAQNQVKLAAAARLAGPTEGSSGTGGLAETLRELSESYQREAPRLRVIRERTTVEMLPSEKVVSEQGKPG